MVNSEYLSDLPENTFNNKLILRMIGNADSFPAEAIGKYGWIYQPQSKTIKLDWPRTGIDGTSYFDD